MSATSTALLAIEQRVQAKIAAQVATVTSHLTAYLGAITRAGTHPTATEMLSRAEVHEALTTVLAGARTKVDEAIRAGYEAAAQLARITTAAELHGLGYTAPIELPDLGGYLDAVAGDVGTAFAAALLDIHDSVRAAYDGVTGDGAPPARVLTVSEAINGASRRLSVRASAAGTVSVNRGFSDAQLALYSDFSTQQHGAVRKRWQVTSANPCASCAALDGSVVDVGALFDHTATTDPLGHNPQVYRDLAAPPRHPNCRCRLVADTAPQAVTAI